MRKKKSFLEKNFLPKEIEVIRKYERLRRTQQRKTNAGKK